MIFILPLRKRERGTVRLMIILFLFYHMLFSPCGVRARARARAKPKPESACVRACA